MEGLGTGMKELVATINIRTSICITLHIISTRERVGTNRNGLSYAFNCVLNDILITSNSSRACPIRKSKRRSG